MANVNLRTPSSYHGISRNQGSPTAGSVTSQNKKFCMFSEAKLQNGRKPDIRHLDDTENNLPIEHKKANILPESNLRVS